MCDTFYVSHNNFVQRSLYFAKNSDREPNEPQVLIYLPEGEKSEPGTYVKWKPYVRQYSVWLSKPTWMWGGEMGVNCKGVAIGNEAVFAKLKAHKQGLLGMDILRVALETSGTAAQALERILELTLTPGQGGSGGYEHPLYYHNSYLIADPKEAYVVETVGHFYAWKRLSGSYNISNKLSIGSDFDDISPQLKNKVRDFARHFINPVVTYAAGGFHREKRGRKLLQRQEQSLASVFGILQDRGTGAVASMRNICMIGGGIISSQTTASLVYDYETRSIWYTQGPCPEVQLFKPLNFKVEKPVTEERALKQWKWNNFLFRAFLTDFLGNKEITYLMRLEHQKKLLQMDYKAQTADVLYQAGEEADRTYISETLKALRPGPIKGSWQFQRYWRHQNARLLAGEREADLLEAYKKQGLVD
ncbi:secernin [Coprothermobacteraceae bacterium]|nr:secernin [Coprothermobacteraceae bacterium]